jgi:tRNA nucleotidyltransferase (CCA-adding enzyme)
LALLHFIGREVENMNFAVYVVGGFVRDLLLNGKSLNLRSADIDIVIEGDAIAFAQQLQADYGGRIVTHKRFGTAKWILDDPAQPVRIAEVIGAGGWSDEDGAELPAHLDFVTARTEFYTAPTVLPTVELSNIKLDLHRRDFTINTLAFSLNPDRWGELLDFYGGYLDLENGIVRVLHSLSFVDDPTRILRAVRYEQRFGFTIEPRTLELLHEALELIDRVTPARIRHELERILQETRPEPVLQRLAALGVLARIHPALVVDAWVERQFARLRVALAQPQPDPLLANAPIERLYWGLLTLRLPAAVHVELSERLGLRSETKQLMHGLERLAELAPRLAAPALSSSQVVALLDHVDALALALYLITTELDPQVAARIHRYREEWQQVRPMLTGSDLQRMGLPPGPLYSRILGAIRTARLDGELSTRAEEVALAAMIARQEDAAH